MNDDFKCMQCGSSKLWVRSDLSTIGANEKLMIYECEDCSYEWKISSLDHYARLEEIFGDKR